jgi:hypothetical protein
VKAEQIMAKPSKHHPGAAQEPRSRERIDALLDEALKETFPASDPLAIGSVTAAIKKEHHKPATPGKPES